MGKPKKIKRQDDGIVYSTDPGYTYDHIEQANDDEQIRKIIVSRSTKGRGGKVATLVEGLTPIKALGELQELKTLCGTGGSYKDEVLLLQGDHREKVADHLREKGYKVAVSG